jgi:transcriptional regulator with XRE-family HTH domain
MRPPHPAKWLIVKAGHTQRAVAKALGYTESDFARVINGYIEPGPRFRAALAKYLGLPEAELFDDDGLLDVDEGVG